MPDQKDKYDLKRFGSYCPARITEQDIADAIAWVRSEPEDKNVDREGFRRVHLVLCEAMQH